MPYPMEDHSEDPLTYRLYTYDVWGNAEDGYDVNDVSRSSITVQFNKEPSDDEVILALKAAGYIKASYPNEGISIEGDAETIYISDAEDGRPDCELRLEN